MQLKFTPQQAQAITNLFEKLFKVAKTPDDRLLQIHMVKIYKKLSAKMEQPKKKYSISVNEAEKITYWIFFRNADLRGYPYERNFIAVQVAEIAESFNQRTNTKLLTL